MIRPTAYPFIEQVKLNRWVCTNFFDIDPFFASTLMLILCIFRYDSSQTR